MHTKATAGSKEKQYYMCTTYSEYGKDKCSNHYIRYELIYAVVLGRLQYWIAQAHEKDDGELLQRLLKSGDKQQAKENANSKKELTRAEKRLLELDNLFAKMYEDRAEEAITGQWLSFVRKYTELTELTAPLLNELIDKIIVHQAKNDENGNRIQEIEIFYRFVGKID